MQTGELRVAVWEVYASAKLGALQKSNSGGLGGGKVVVEQETGDQPVNGRKASHRRKGGKTYLEGKGGLVYFNVLQ